MLQPGERRPEQEHFGFGGWILPSHFVGLSSAWLESGNSPPCASVSPSTSQGRCPQLWVVACCSSQGLCRWSSSWRGERGFGWQVGADGVGGSGMGRAGERGSFSSIPPPPNLCPPATGTGHVFWVPQGQWRRGGDWG